MSRSFQLHLKRLFDIIFSLILLIITSPIILISLILIALESRGPVIFVQERLGKNGKVFLIFKMRTMYHKNRNESQVLPGNSEVTVIGHYLRRFKIDELLQLVNVFKGDMSFVGPRPCLPSLRVRFDENGFYRLQVRPGLTGLAQVNGNIYLSWPERWVYDRTYVEKFSLLLDIKILMRTVIIVLQGENNFKKK